MKRGRILDLLFGLSSKEKAEFRLFLQSPFFVRKNAAELMQLFELLQNTSSGGGFSALDVSWLHGEIYKGKTYSKTRIYGLFQQLEEITEWFVSIAQLQRDGNQHKKSLLLATELRRQQLQDPFKKLIESLKNELDGDSPLTEEQLFSRYQVAIEEHEWESLFNNEKTDLAAPDAIQALDKFFLYTRMKLENSYRLQQRLSFLQPLPTHMHQPFRQEMLDWYIQKHPLLQIQSRILNLFAQNRFKREQFEDLMHVIQTHASRIADSVLKELVTYLRNFCTLLINEGEYELKPLLHRIQVDSLERGYFYYDGKISIHALLSITVNALSVQNTEWARHFVEAHQNRIIGDNQDESHFKLNLALCCFHEKKYDEALELITFDYMTSTHYMLARRLELKVYYETESELLPYKAEAFRKYLLRTVPKSIDMNFWKSHQNFINILLQLIQTAPKDEKRAKRIVSRIREMRSVADRQWLMEKVSQML